MSHGLEGNRTKRLLYITKSLVIEPTVKVDIRHMQKVSQIDLNFLLTDQLRMDTETLNQTLGLGNPHGTIKIGDTVVKAIELKEMVSTGKN